VSIRGGILTEAVSSWRKKVITLKLKIKKKNQQTRIRPVFTLFKKPFVFYKKHLLKLAYCIVFTISSKLKTVLQSYLNTALLMISRVIQ
jgi:hypothetical protein